MKIKSPIGIVALWSGGVRAFDPCRRLVCVALMIAAAAGQSSAAHAEPPTTPQITECRAWAQHYWHWVDTGEIDPAWVNFEFSFPTGDNFNPLLPSLVAFEEIYAARLGGLYTLEDLLRDDPAVLQAFRHHSVTGEVATPVSDPPATEMHLRLIVGALRSGPEEAGEPCDEVTSSVSDDGLYFAISGAALQSNILVSNKKPCPTPNPDPGLPVADPFKEKVLEILEDSGLRRAYSCLYEPDGKWFWSAPGFDCDDFALAARNYLYWRLRGQFPGARYGFLRAYWWESGIDPRSAAGHALVLIEHEGKWYVVDPGAGSVLGPFSSSDSKELRDAVWELMRDKFGVRDPWYRRIIRSLRPSDGPGEPEPWFTDPAQRQRVKDCLGIDSDDFFVDPGGDDIR